MKDLQMVNVPPRRASGHLTITIPQSTAPTQEERIRKLEDQVAALMALISINGNDVEIKTMGKLKIQAYSVDVSANSPNLFTNFGKGVARKNDPIGGKTQHVAVHGHLLALRGGVIE
jgi:hypothetical protein